MAPSGAKILRANQSPTASTTGIVALAIMIRIQHDYLVMPDAETANGMLMRKTIAIR